VTCHETDDVTRGIKLTGKLSDDIRIQNENSVVFITITSMIVFSPLLTLLANPAFRH
jgi:Protein of unknown function (DUF2905)